QAATAAAELAQEEEERSAKLHERGLLAEMDLRRTRAMASQRASEAAALRQAVARLGRESKREQTDRRAHVDQIAREIAELEGREVTSVAIARRLEEEIARRRIRAPVAGRIGEIAKVRPGSVVAAGDHLATVIPTAQLKVTAAFSPAAALARIAPGQPANLRLDGFPWTSYGTLKATVTRVASEPRQGLLWVDCRIEPASGSRLPRQHGLTGTLAVEVERISPLELALRAAGKAADPRRARTSADG
ncbi:MAG: HlyD family efflux transporter periplasmic adaptor subunit, partial [bacterium]|nr:HlyD family efflux transporter periplasmic adaptor subunit [bacterium]